MFGRVHSWDERKTIAPAQCRTSDEVRALARKYARRVRAPVVRVTWPISAPPEPPTFMSYGIAVACTVNGTILSPTSVEVNEPKIGLRVADIAKTCARFYGVDMIDLRSARKHTKVCHARQVTMYLARKFTVQSLPEIGRRLGGKDHTTVLHAVRKIEGLIATNEDLAAEIAELRRQLSV